MSITEQRPTDTTTAAIMANAAQRRLDKTEMYRLVQAAARQRTSQRKIADLADVSQTEIVRILGRLREHPSLVDRSPSEVINERVAGKITARQMMKELLDWDYTFGRVPIVNGQQLDAYDPGTWDEVESAYHRNLISENEFREIFERHAAELEVAAKA
ncbi:winged helix-turn-helix domain-containing protein [Rhodococcus sp. ARC_M6]|uniref:winged helix-turn-helix domain-containing protein n=1 Tax=Rhodococcus sp. ARC_M6 TaxID=2928852 RepID=UPI001FB54CA8|nr:winged helix-turn-helix domain-containing protein [Rhodococcus sp. ARC_M6]MCJ0907128.1 winged helix-turn-helix domain-containing protein [Rhodococcus sp. ARC_M6]